MTNARQNETWPRRQNPTQTGIGRTLGRASTPPTGLSPNASVLAMPKPVAVGTA